MDGARQHLLAGAGLAEDEDRNICAGGHTGAIEHALHGGGEADDVFEAGMAFEVFFELGDAFAELVDLHQARDLFADGLEIEWLGDVILSAPFDGFDGCLDGAVAGHDDDGDIGVDAAELLGEGEAVGHGHYEIDEREGDARVGSLDGLGLGGGERDLHAIALAH